LIFRESVGIWQFRRKFTATVRQEFVSIAVVFSMFNIFLTSYDGAVPYTVCIRVLTCLT
jgi:hypothetical protein